MFNSSAKLSLALAEGMPELCSVPHARPLQPPSLRLRDFPISQQITPDHDCCVSGGSAGRKIALGHRVGQDGTPNTTDILRITILLTAREERQ
jgi:hypothetical protein